MRIYIVISFLVLSGCSTIGDIVIPPHERSQTKSGTKVCVQFHPTPDESPAFLVPIAMAIIEKGIDLISKGIKSESKRYGATYSGKTYDELFKIEITGTNSSPLLNVDTFSVLYLFGDAAEKPCDSDFITAEKKQ